VSQGKSRCGWRSISETASRNLLENGRGGSDELGKQGRNPWEDGEAEKPGAHFARGGGGGSRRASW